MRFLGVDYGSSRTGLAVSDPLGISCRPLGILAEKEEEGLVGKILTVAKEQLVDGIVVGVPRPLAGGTNQQMETVLAFVRRLDIQASVPVCTWDERFTTSLAEKGGAKREARDAVAACYMLQSYLDSRTDDLRG